MTKKISSVLDQIIKEYGNVVLDAEHLKNDASYLIPTTPSLDIALNGGLVEGIITTISGPFGSGKSTLALHIAAQAQRKYKKECFYIDAEGKLQDTLLNTISGLVCSEAEEKETGIPRIRVIKSTKGNMLHAEKILDICSRLVNDSPGCIVILDSIAALCTEAVSSANMQDSNKVGSVQKYLYIFFRQMAQTLTVTKSSIICITHLQANIGSYGGGTTEFGGKSVGYFSSCKLKCNSSKEFPDTGTVKDGRNSEFVLEKNPRGRPHRGIIVPIRYGVGVDVLEDLIAVAEEYGFVDRAGAWYTLKMDENPKFQGKNNLKEYLKENTAVASALNNAIRELVFGKKE